VINEYFTFNVWQDESHKDCALDTMCIVDDYGDCIDAYYGYSRTDDDYDRWYVAGDSDVWIRKSGRSNYHCPIETLTQVWDDFAREWTDIDEIVPWGTDFDYAITTYDDGHVEVYVDDYYANDFCLSQTYRIRVTYTSVQSTSPMRSVYDEFTVNIAAYDDQKLTLRSEEVKQMTYEVYDDPNVMWYNPIWWYDWDPVFDLDNIDYEPYSQCPIVCALQVQNKEGNGDWLWFDEWAD